MKESSQNPINLNIQGATSICPSLFDTILITLKEFNNKSRSDISSEGLIWVSLIQSALKEMNSPNNSIQIGIIDILIKSIRKHADKVQELEMKQVARFYDPYQWTRDVMKSFLENVYPESSDLELARKLQIIETDYISAIKELKWKNYIQASYDRGLSMGFVLNFSPLVLLDLTPDGENYLTEFLNSERYLECYNMTIGNFRLGLHIVITEFRQIVLDYC